MLMLLRVLMFEIFIFSTTSMATMLIFQLKKTPMIIM